MSEEELPAPRNTPRLVTVAANIVAIIVLLAIAASLLPSKSFWITDNGNRWIQMESLERTGGEIWIDYPGRSIDPALRFFPRGGHHFLVNDGRIASFYGTAFPALASLLHPLLGDSVRIVIPLGGTLLLLVMVALLAVKFSVNPVAAIWLVTFATPVAFYSLTFWEHTLATGLILGGLWLAGKRSVPRLVLGGALIGISIVFREEGYVVAAGLILFLLTGRKWVDLAALSAGLLAIVGIHWQTLRSVHGSILGPHISVYLGLDPERSGFATKLVDYVVYLFQFGADPVMNAILVLPHLAVIGVIVDLYRRGADGSRLAVGVVLMTALSSFWFGGTALVDSRPDFGTLVRQGLFPSLPLLVPALIGAWIGWRARRREMISATTIVLTLIALTPSLLHSRDIGIIWGPRHFFHLFPLVVLLALVGFGWLRDVRSEPGWRLLARVAIGLLIAGSVLIQLAGLRALVEKRVASAHMIEAIESVGEGVIVTDVYWLPEELGSIFYDHLILSARTNEEVIALVNQLNRAGIESFAFVTTSAFGNVSHGLLEQLAVDRKMERVEMLGTLEMTIFECDLREAARKGTAARSE